MLTQNAAGDLAGVSLGPVTPGAKQSVIMAFDGLNSKGIVTDGTIKRLISGAELSGLTTLALGSARGGSGQLAGPLLISGISVGAGTITDAEMVSMLGVQP